MIAQRAALHCRCPREIRLHWFEDRAAVIARAANAISDAAVACARDTRHPCRPPRLRESDGDARCRGDGVTAERLGYDGPLGWSAESLMRPGGHFLPLESRLWLGHETNELVAGLGASRAFTAPRRTDSTAILVAAYERFALKAMSLGLA